MSPILENTPVPVTRWLFKSRGSKRFFKIQKTKTVGIFNFDKNFSGDLDISFGIFLRRKLSINWLPCSYQKYIGQMNNFSMVIWRGKAENIFFFVILTADDSILFLYPFSWLKLILSIHRTGDTFFWIFFHRVGVSPGLWCFRGRKITPSTNP